MGTRPLAEWLVRRAALRLPAAIQEECCREWLAEIPAILEDSSVRFGWRRAFRAFLFAVDQWRGLGHLSAAAQDPSVDDEVGPAVQSGDHVLIVGTVIQGKKVLLHVSETGTTWVDEA